MSQSRHRSSLFLLELILVIFFFSLASAVCIQLFIKAHLTEQETKALTRAVPLAESAAEGFHSVSGDLEQMKNLFPEGHLSEAGDSFWIVYDEEWHPLETGEGVYTLTVMPTDSSAASVSDSGEGTGDGQTLARAIVRVNGEQGTIYELSATVQIPRTVPAS